MPAAGQRNRPPGGAAGNRQYGDHSRQAHNPAIAQPSPRERFQPGG
jgi:hypothetical protein